MSLLPQFFQKASESWTYLAKFSVKSRWAFLEFCHLGNSVINRPFFLPSYNSKTLWLHQLLHNNLWRFLFSVKSAQFNNKDLNEDFGVAETETLQHFAKPKPPRNRRRPRNTTKVAPLLSDLQEEPENRENDLEINRQVMRKSTSSLKSSQASKSKEELSNGMKKYFYLLTKFLICTYLKVFFEQIIILVII